MLVETYELRDDAAPEMQEDMTSPEALQLIEALGLEGQQTLLRPKAEGEGLVRSPYRPMTTEEARIYGALFPKTTELQRFASSAVPLRVLQVAAHAKQFLPHLYVWHGEDARYADPVLVGYAEPGWYTNQPRGVPHILARWGDALLSLDELRELACEKLRTTYKAKLDSHVAACRIFEASLAGQLLAWLGGSSVADPLAALSGDRVTLS